MEEKLIDLLEVKTFDELTTEEKKIVLAHLSEEEYTAQNRVISGLYDLNSPTQTALPLQLKEVKKRIVVPLWQVLIGAACLVLGFVLLYPKTETFANDNSAKVKTIIDTLIVQKTDTLYLTKDITETKFIYKTDTVRIVEKVPASNGNELNNLTISTPRNNSQTGTSLKEDRDLGWVPKRIEL